MKKLTLDIKDLVNRLDISTRKIFTSQLVGNYQTIFRGEGLEFFGYSFRITLLAPFLLPPSLRNNECSASVV